MTGSATSGDGLSSAEIATLAGQLRRLVGDGLGVPNLPFVVLEALRGLTSVPVVELCVLDDDGAVLLIWRDDVHWRGWHFPGGFMAPWESIAQACARVGQRELGAVFTLQGVVGVEGWADHPYASPVSLLCRGVLDRPPAEGRFFPSPPEDLIKEQRTYFASIRADRGIVVDRARTSPL